MKNKTSMLSKYSVGNQYFALWQLSGQLRVFETGNHVLDESAADVVIVIDTGKCFLNLKSVTNTTRTDCLVKGKKTALCWSTQKSKSKSPGCLLFIGGAYGIEAIDVIKGEVIWRAQIENGVADIAIHDGYLYFASLLERVGGKLDPVDGTILANFRIGKHKGKHLLPILGQEKLIIAGSHLVLWDGINEKKLVKYSGHTNEVSVLCLSPCGNFFFTGAEDERQFAAWSIHTTHRDAICVFTMDDPMINISTALLHDAILVCALSTQGLVSIWKCEDVTTEKWSTNKWATIQLEEDRENAIFSVQIEVQINKVMVHLVHGNVAFPLFEYCALPEITSSPMAIILDKKVSRLLEGEASKTESEDRKKRKRQVNVIGADNDGDGVQIIQLMNTSKPGDHPSKTLSTDSKQELTLGERLAQLENKRVNLEPREERTEKTFLSASSAAVLVKQINQSGDIELFIRLTQLPRDLMMSTVRHLAEIDAAKFLQFCIDRLRIRPKDAFSVIHWIRALIKVHAAYLMSSANIQQQLTFVHQLIENRVAVFDTLVSMSGRLDVLLSQIDAQKQSRERKEEMEFVEMDLSENESVFEEMEYEDVAVDKN